MKRYTSPETTVLEVVTENILQIVSGVENTVDFNTNPSGTPTTDEALGKSHDYGMWEE